eukprot:jgi/Phyca11/127237/e_gw1.67.87.1
MNRPYKFLYLKSDGQNKKMVGGNERLARRNGSCEPFIFEWATARPSPNDSTGLSSAEASLCRKPGPSRMASGTQARRSGCGKQTALVRAAATGESSRPSSASLMTIQRVLQLVDHLVYSKMDRTLPLTATQDYPHAMGGQVHTESR